MARKKFTDRFVATCALPAAGRIEHSDILCPGLHLRVTCRGVRSFSVVVRHGAVRRYTLGRYPILSLAAARGEAIAILRRIAEGAEARPKPAITVRNLVEQYVDLHLRPNVKTWQNVRSCLLQLQMDTLAALAIDRVRAPDIVMVLDAIAANGTPHAAVNLLKALRAMFNWAVARGALTANPCQSIRAPVRTTQRDRVLSDAEIGAILNACDRVRAPFGDMVRVLMLTGARRNEVAHMRWCEINGNIWTLPAARSKSGRANALPLPPAVMQILDRLTRHGDNTFVFTTTEGRRPSSDFTKRKRELDAASGTSAWCLHDARRTARGKLSQLNVPWEVARRVVGHSVDQLDAVYDRYSYIEEKGRALLLLANHYAKLCSVRDPVNLRVDTSHRVF